MPAMTIHTGMGLLLLCLTMNVGCVALDPGRSEPRSETRFSSYDEPELHELEYSDGATYGDPRYADPVERKRLEETWGAGESVALLTGTYASKRKNFAVNVPLASWYVREQDRKGMGLVGGAIAYDMLTTHRIEGRAVSQKKTSFGLLGVAGSIDERALDGSGGYRKYNWVFPFFRYENVNGERTLYPFFIFPVPLERDSAPPLDAPPWQATADAPIDPLPVEAEVTPVTTTEGGRTMTLKSAPSTRGHQSESVDRISKWLRDRPTQERELAKPRSTKDPNRARGSWKSRAGAPTDTRKKPEPTGDTYKVRKGDTLYSIARRQLGSGRDWKRLYDANRSQLSNPDQLREGMVLRLPR